MEQYVIRGGQAGYERLKLLNRALGPHTSALFDLVGVGPGMRCLDVGCGGGEVSFELATRIGDAGHVVGLDLDEVKLTLGRADAAQRGLGNVDFRVGNAYALAEPAAYDIVFCRMLLQHLSRPVDVLRRMWAAVRPGGAIVVEDADFPSSFCEPANQGFDFYLRTYCAVLEGRGGDPSIGRRLYAHFAAAGIPGANVDVVQRVDFTGDTKELTYSTLDATAEAIVDAGIAPAGEITVALTELDRATRDPATLIGLPRTFRVWARRDPSAASPEPR